jgi:hypothetical protein
MKKIVSATVMVLMASLMWAGVKKSADNVVSYSYRNVIDTRKVDIKEVYNSVREVLNDEHIPHFTSQVKGDYQIETEWMAIKRGTDTTYDVDHRYLTPPTTWQYPLYLKYYIKITKKNYSVNAVTTSGGIQWVSYDLSYKAQDTVDVRPQTEFWYNLVHLSRKINVALKFRLDGKRYSEIFSGPGGSLPYNPGGMRTQSDWTVTYPEMARSIESGNSWVSPPSGGSVPSPGYPPPVPSSNEANRYASALPPTQSAYTGSGYGGPSTGIMTVPPGITPPAATQSGYGNYPAASGLPSRTPGGEVYTGQGVTYGGQGEATYTGKGSGYSGSAIYGYTPAPASPLGYPYTSR